MLPSFDAGTEALQPVRRGRTSSALVWNLILSAFSMLVIFAIMYGIMPRRLSEKQMGVFSMLWTVWLGLILICQSGLQGALLRYVPELEAKGSYRQMTRLYYAILASQLGFWVLCAVALYAGRRLDIAGLGLLPLVPLLITLISVPFRLVINSQLAVLQAFRDIKWMAIAQVLTRTIALVLIFILVAHVLPGAEGKIIACFVVLAATDLLTSVLTQRTMTRHFRQASVGDATVPVRRLAWYAGPLIIRSVMTFIEQGQATPLLMGILGGEALAGYYQLAYFFPSRVVEFVPVAIWPVVLASFAEAYTRDRRYLAAGLQLYTKLLFAMLLPLAVGGALFGDRVIQVVSGPRYELAFLPCQVFFALIALHIFSAPLSVCLHVVEKTWLFMVTAAVGAIANLGVVILIVPLFTAPTVKLLIAVVAVAVDWVLVMAIQYRYVKRLAPGFRPPWSALGRTVAGCLVIVPAVAMTYLVQDWTWLHLVAVTALCGGLTVLGYRVFRVIDAATLKIILSSRLPLKRAVAAVLASPRVVAETQKL